MDVSTSACSLARHLVGIIQPWNHQASNDLEPTRNDRAMYVYREDHDSNTTADPDDDPNTLDGAMPTWQTLVFILAFFVVIILTLLMRDGICRLCGYGAGRRPLIPHSSQHPLGADEGVQTETIRRLSPEAIRERQLEKQRLERRLWYSYYLKPFLTVLTEEHFRTGDKQVDKDQEKEEVAQTPLQLPDSSNEESPALQDEPAIMHEVVDVDDLHESPNQPTDVDLESAAVSAATTKEGNEDSLLICKPVGSLLSEGEEFPTKSINLWDPHDTTLRRLDAECSICLLDYEVGDTIVRSAADEEQEFCIHVFHQECMLQWLSQGRKRCPICRHWFVPAVRIKEQMKQAHVVTRNSLHHLYDARTMEDVVSLSGDTDSDMSGSFTTTTNDAADHAAGDIEQGLVPVVEQTSSRTTEVILSDNAQEAAPLEASQPPTSPPHHHHRHHRRHSHPMGSVDYSLRIEGYAGMALPSPWLLPRRYEEGQA